VSEEVAARSPGAPSFSCPAWCVSSHGQHGGEEDWIHLGQPLAIADGIDATLCMSVDPETGVQDGPYVLIGSTELSLDAAAALGSALIRLTS